MSTGATGVGVAAGGAGGAAAGLGAAGLWAAGIGAVGAGVASYFNYRAQKSYLKWLKKYLAPDLAAKKVALPALTQLALGYYGPKLGKGSSILASQHTLNLGDISRQLGMAQRSSARYWGLRGDTGRGRGEALRIRMAGSRARALENLGYAQGQEQYKQGNAAMYGDILSRLGGLGAAGNSLAGSVAELGMTASQGFYGDLAAFFGDMAANYGWKADQSATFTPRRKSTNKPMPSPSVWGQ